MLVEEAMAMSGTVKFMPEVDSVENRTVAAVSTRVVDSTAAGAGNPPV
jgi:hypothetical protein